jgi:hypothetical protein
MMNRKTFYCYSDKGEFQGSYPAQESPLEPGVYIRPILSTDIEPPTFTEGQVAIFENDAWSLVVDYRGKIWYNKITGESVEIDFIGEPENLVPTIPEIFVIKKLRSDKVEEINWAAIVAITGGFTSTALGKANTYPNKSTDQQNINSVSLVGGSLWCLNDAGVWSFTAHTKSQAVKVQADMVAHIQKQQKKCADLISQVNGAKTIDEIKAIVWA